MGEILIQLHLTNEKVEKIMWSILLQCLQLKKQNLPLTSIETSVLNIIRLSANVLKHKQRRLVFLLFNVLIN